MFLIMKEGFGDDNFCHSNEQTLSRAGNKRRRLRLRRIRFAIRTFPFTSRINRIVEFYRLKRIPIVVCSLALELRDSFKVVVEVVNQNLSVVNHCRDLIGKRDSRLPKGTVIDA